jgi:hypothetical protein
MEMNTLDDFFKNINPSRCPDLKELSVNHLTRSFLSSTVVQEISLQLSLTTGEKIQLARFANGLVPVQYVSPPRNIAALLRRIGRKDFVPKAAEIKITSLRYDQLSSDKNMRVCECTCHCSICIQATVSQWC